jgi:HK97 family phage major capsid protein
MELNAMEQLGSTIKSDLEKSNTELKNEIKGLQDQFDQLSAKNVDMTAKSLSFAEDLKSQLSSTNPELLSKGYKLELKAVATKPAGDMNPEFKPGITGFANRKVNVRQLLAVGSTSSDAIRYVKESGYTNGAGIKQEGIKAGESTFSIEQATALVKTVATFLVVSKEMLSDVDGITSYLANRVPAKLAEKEDAELLNGTGDIKGLTTTAQPFASTTLTLGATATPNEYDVLRVGINMIAVADYSASAILVHPTDKTKLELLKDSTGHYIFQSGNMSVSGVPVVESTAITEGSFLIGDFRMGAELKERSGVALNFYAQDADNVQKGLVTIGIEERIALPVYHNGAFVSGTFAAAKTKLKS